LIELKAIDATIFLVGIGDIGPHIVVGGMLAARAGFWTSIFSSMGL